MQSGAIDWKTRELEQRPLEVLYALKRMAALAIRRGGLQWRRHGIGVMQAYLEEGLERELRLHVWSSRLALPGISLSGDAHNHRFSMVSTILAGHLQHEELDLLPNDIGEAETWDFVHARAQTEETRTAMDRTGSRYTVRTRPYMFGPGCAYHFPRGAFHRSVPHSEIVVTLVMKYDQRSERAQVVAPIARQPVPAFSGAALDERAEAAILGEAYHALASGL